MPTWFQTVNAVILLIVTVAIACSTWQQARIAQVKLQQDFFDRRFRVYDATRHLLAEICRHGDVWLEDRRTFIIETGGAGFVFDDDDLAKFLAEVLRSHYKPLMISNPLCPLGVNCGQRPWRKKMIM